MIIIILVYLGLLVISMAVPVSWWHHTGQTRLNPRSLAWFGIGCFMLALMVRAYENATL